MMEERTSLTVREKLEEKIKILSQFAWERRVGGDVVAGWVSQFDDDSVVEYSEQIHALFLLSNFLYFGQDELRCLLKSLFRDHIQAPMLRDIRRSNADTRDRCVLEREFNYRLARIRFVPVGNPAESGAHLLYYFRQENALRTASFVSSHQIFSRTILDSTVRVTVRDASIMHYVFIDDLCGSGDQVRAYCRDVVEPLRALAPGVKISYYALFGTAWGLRAVRSLGLFGEVGAVVELDESFKVFDASSRIFEGEEGPFPAGRVRATCEKYGLRLWRSWPLGYGDGQLAIGFSHNTPDNSLPIFWGGREAGGGPWKPVFKRYSKVY